MLHLPKGSVRLFVCLIVLVPDRRLVSHVSDGDNDVLNLPKGSVRLFLIYCARTRSEVSESSP